jgi:RNA polymerase sigma-70 factor (ECF subfamily)
MSNGKMNNVDLKDAVQASDADLIAAILQGEKESYAVIISRYNQRLYRVGMGILDDDSEVEDAMQTAYIHAYENLSKFAFKSSFSTWLTRILINECLLRLKKRKKTLTFDSELMENSMKASGKAEYRLPDSRMLQSELKNLLETAISSLPEKYRVVFVMREMEKMNVAETGECLAITEENVKVRLNRAKAMLRNSLADYYKEAQVLHFHLSRCKRMSDNVMKIIREA